MGPPPTPPTSGASTGTGGTTQAASGSTNAAPTNVGTAVDFLFDTEFGQREKEQFDSGALVVPLWVRQRRAAVLSESLYELRENYEIPEGETDMKSSCQKNRVGTEMTFKTSHIDATFLSDLRMQMFYEPLQFKVTAFHSKLIDKLPSRPKYALPAASADMETIANANTKGFRLTGAILATAPLSAVADKIGTTRADLIKNITPLPPVPGVYQDQTYPCIFEYDTTEDGKNMYNITQTVKGNARGTVFKVDTQGSQTLIFPYAATCVAVDPEIGRDLRPGLTVGIPGNCFGERDAYSFTTKIVYVRVCGLVHNVNFKGDTYDYNSTVLITDMIHPCSDAGTNLDTDYHTAHRAEYMATAEYIYSSPTVRPGHYEAALDPTNYYVRGDTARTTNGAAAADHAHLCLYAPVDFLMLENLFGDAFLRDLSETDPGDANFNGNYHFSPFMQARDVMFKTDLQLGDADANIDQISGSGFYKLFKDIDGDGKSPYLQVANRNRFVDEAENYMIHYHSNFQPSNYIKEGCIFFAPKFAIDGMYDSDIKENLGLTEAEITATTAQIYLPGLRYRPDFWSHFSKFTYTYAGNEILDCIPPQNENHPYVDGWSELESRIFYPKQNLLRAGATRKLNFRKNRKHTDAVPDSYVEKSRNAASYGFGLVQFSCPLPNMRQGEGRLHSTFWPLRAQTNDPKFEVGFRPAKDLVSDEDDMGRSYAARLGIQKVCVGDTHQANAVYTDTEADKLLREWLNYAVPLVQNDVLSNRTGRYVRDISSWAELESILPVGHNILRAIRDFSSSAASAQLIKAEIKHVRCVAEKQIVGKDMESAFVNKYTKGVVIPVPRILTSVHLLEASKMTNNIIDINLGGTKLDVEIIKAFIVGIRRRTAIAWQQTAAIDELSDRVAPLRIPYIRNYGNSPMSFLPVIEGMDFLSGDSSLFTRSNNSLRSVRDHMQFRSQYSMQDTQVIHATGSLQNLVYWCITSDMLLAFYGMDRRSIDMNQIVHPKLRLKLKAGTQVEGLEAVLYAVTQNGLIKMSGNEEMIMKQNGVV